MRNLAAKIFAVVLTVGPLAPAQAGGIPVYDATNVVQSTVSAMEAVKQTLSQIEQYRTQLLQYETQLRNAAAPAAYIWDQAQSTIGDLMAAVDTLNYYKGQVGGLDGYLDKFKDLEYYRTSPCFTAQGCSDAERAALEENKRLASESQKRANDAWLRGLDQQQDKLRSDARTLEHLQTNAQGAEGQMQALGYANQFAAQQANQLLQLRGLLLAQQTAIATRMQADADERAQQMAASERFRRTDAIQPSTGRTW